MCWLTITGIVLDFIWLGFVAWKVSLIDYMNLPAADILTYILIVVKVVFLFYLVLVEKAFSS